MLNVTSDQVEQLLAAAQAHLSARRLPEAEQLLHTALRLNPQLPTAHHTLGIVMLLTQRHDQALAAFKASIAITPTAEACLNLIQLLHFTGQKPESLDTARQAAAKFPNDHRLVCELGRALEHAGLYDEAMENYQRAHQRWTNAPLLLLQLASLLFFQGQVSKAVDLYRQAVLANPQHAQLHSAMLFTLHFLPGTTASQLLREHEDWHRRHAQPLQRDIRPFANPKDPDRRLRIGYVSPNFRNHSVGRFIAPLLTHHDHTHFQIFAYSDAHTPDHLTQRIHAAVDVFRPSFGQSDAHLADLIRQDGIDILVDLTMHMPSNRLLVFARKPAPIQMTYLAYAGTTGLPTIDYRLSDPYLDPPKRDHVYTERTLRLPTYWCYEPLPDSPEPLRSSPTAPLTFACLNNFAKVSPAALEIWSRILHQLPDSQLLLHCVEGQPRHDLLAAMAGLGISEPRLRFAGRIPLPQFLLLHQQIDIALDPFPYGGGTTSCDALYMGVPLITLNDTSPEALAVGRGGTSILSQLGLTDLIAHSTDDYIRIALDLARNPARRAHLRETLRPTMHASPLMNAPTFARSIESTYRQIWQEHCTKCPPHSPPPFHSFTH